MWGNSYVDKAYWNGVARMIKEWLLKQILRNRMVLFDNNNNEFIVINDIYFDDGVMICKKTDLKEFSE